MADLLTHVLFVYIILTVSSWYVDMLRSYVSVAMIGAVIPDLAKIRLVLGSDAIEAALNVPFSWFPVHRAGGILAVAGLGSLFFIRTHRLRGFVGLCFGASTGLLLDTLVIRANGVVPPYLYPFSWWQPPSLDLYLSSDVWPALVVIPLAVGVWWVDRFRVTLQ